MRRREFVTGLGCAAAAAWPRAVRAQQKKMPVIGILGATSRAGPQQQVVDWFYGGLLEMGIVEGQNVAIEYRWAEGRYERLPELAADLVRQRVAVICTFSNVATLAAKGATSEIPIVFVVGVDPVQMGLVSAINRPGGNATGVFVLASVLEPKRFELLRELLPQVALVAALVNPDNPNAENNTKDVQAAARTWGLQPLILTARNVADIDVAFAMLVQQRAGALIITSDPVFLGQRHRFADLAARNAIPAIYPWREFVAAGGLLSYGHSLTDVYHQLGLYTGRILKGEKPADLPVLLPAQFELVINLKTARALGLDVPVHLQQRADEVIE